MDEQLLEGLSEAFAAIDEQGRITAWNSRASELFGVARDEALGAGLFGLVFTDDAREELYEAFNLYLASARSDILPHRSPTRVRTPQGELALELTIIPLSHPNGASFHVFFHEHELAERAKQRLEAVVEASDDAIITTDRSGRVASWNQAAHRLYGYAAEEMVGQPLDRIIPGEHTQKTQELLQAALGGTHVERMETERLTKGGDVVPVQMTLRPLFASSSESEPVGLSLIEHDISELKRYEEQVRYLAEHDVLTGLFNRRRFHTELERALADGDPGSVLLTDIDAFKLVNDAHGHERGDELLRELSRLLGEQLQDGDVLAHFHGDEFALLVRCEPGEALRRAAGILTAVETRLASALSFELPHRLTCSIGIAHFESAPTDADDLLVAADLALHAAKEHGGGRSVVYDSDLVSGVRQAERLQRALREERLALYAQPILEIASDEITGYELLLRVRDGEEVISAAGFLAAAERLGVIGEIDRWVVERGIELAARGVRVEINLSAHSMTDRALLGLIRSRIDSTGADPADVIFEITETAAIASLTEAQQFARELEAIGCQFALDDFGTGFGSFAYLKHLPVAILKIDGEFIRNLAESRIDRRIVRAIVLVAEALEQQTVAEWVGDQRSLEILRELGVTYAQGYLIGQPVPVEEIAPAPLAS